MTRELRRRLKEVDPNLTVIPGGVRRRTKRSSLNEEDWEKTEGVICDSCSHSTLRVFCVCPDCIKRARLPDHPMSHEEQMDLEFPLSEWDFLKRYDFKKVTSYEFRHKKTGKVKAYDIFKEEDEKGITEED